MKVNLLSRRPLRTRLTLWLFAATVAAQLSASAQPTWQEELAKMPLTNGVTELNRSNCVALFLAAFHRNPAVRGIVFMPGATDEFYFFRRAHAKLTNGNPTLLDAVIALTNQTYIRVLLRPPLLLLRTDQDPVEPDETVQDQKTADSIKKHKYAKDAVYNDRDWDYVRHLLGIYLNINVKPGPATHDSNHFFRHSFVAYDLNGWEALEATALAGKTKFTVRKGTVLFEGDERFYGAAPTEGFSLLKQ
jgi:hypothetical protein